MRDYQIRALKWRGWVRPVCCLMGLFCLGMRVLSAADSLPEGWRAADPVVSLINRGVAQMGQYDYAAAVDTFSAAVEQAPGLLEANLNLAIALFNRAAKEDLAQAAALADMLVDRFPDDIRVLFLRGVMALFAGEDETARQLMERVLERDPSQSHAWFLLARSKEHSDLNYRDDLERAVELNPGLVSAYYYLMRVAIKEGDRAKAEEYRDQFTRLRESPLADTVVLPQYQQMGPLALAQLMPDPPTAPVTLGELSIESGAWLSQTDTGEGAEFFTGAWGDLNGDGLLDLVALRRHAQRPVGILLGRTGGALMPPVYPSLKLPVDWSPSAIALGDYDNDGVQDLYLVGASENVLLRGEPELEYEDVTASAGGSGGGAETWGAFFLDLDHDADLDLFLCNRGADMLLLNQGDGRFADVSQVAGVANTDRASIGLAAADIDGDRDLDLLVVHETGAPTLLINERFGRFRVDDKNSGLLSPASAGLMQDFSGDGRPDLVLLPRETGAGGGLFLGDGAGGFTRSAPFDGVLAALASHGSVRAMRFGDWDLDGDWDVALFSSGGHLLLNDGRGRFRLLPEHWSADELTGAISLDCIDADGDGHADLVLFKPEGIQLLATRMTPPGTWLGVSPTGHRGADKRTRSPASGYGTRLGVRCGLHSQTLFFHGLNGGRNQSHLPAVFGLGGATQADSLSFVWPDGVTQVEISMAAGEVHRVMELERKVSSCPVLFSWDGRHFEFVTDFAGVGGLGYYVAPGEYAPPQIQEAVKLEPHQLQPKAGLFELRICEPMEEVAYIDRLELCAIDHPAGTDIYPDERLAVSGPPPSHRLLSIDEPVFPVAAHGPEGADCTDRILRVDRTYAYQPKLDRRYMGFCTPHSLVLRFDDRLAAWAADDPVFLMMHGWIEYPYSQTTYAAAQSEVGWEPMRLELLEADGSWRTLLEDAGAPGGMGRMFTVDVTGLLPRGGCTLRLTTNLEIYVDQLYLARDAGLSEEHVHTAPLVRAEARRLGFPLEYSPDGGHPLLYTYDIIEASSPFKVPRGRYTRFGPVEELVMEFDDRYVIIGSGDELAVSFDATGLPVLPEGWVRSYILISHAYCKDMDLYTAEGDTVAPLPFAAMSAYPYPADEPTPFDDPAEGPLGVERW